MLPTIATGNVASAIGGGYEVANSCRFNSADSAYMHKSQSGGNRRTFTLSFWIKRGKIGNNQKVFTAGTSGTEAGFQFYDGSTENTLRFYEYTGSDAILLAPNRLLRDNSAWYHICVAVDTTQGVAANRVKYYTNGVQETSFATATYPSENYDTLFNNSGSSNFVGFLDSHSAYFDGYMAEVCLIDGLALTPTSFGEFSEDSPNIWMPKDVSGLTFGTNGFYLDFEASDNLGNDANGGTDLTEVNLAATDQASDSPTNNFCVMNPLTASSYSTLSEGNTKTAGNSSSDNGNVVATIVPSSGKWYCECKIGNKQGTGYPSIGMAQASDPNFGTVLNSTVGTAGYNYPQSGIYRPDGQKYSDNGTAAFGSGNSFDTNDIMMMAMDCDNGAFYIGKNGSWISDGTNTGDPTSAGSKTGAFLTWTPANKSGQTFATRDFDSSVMLWNFGSPSYANTSDAADADGYGAFEYAPPTGYFALCTKNLAEYG